MHSNDEAFLKTPFSYVSSFDIICFSICKYYFLGENAAVILIPQHTSFDLFAFNFLFIWKQNSLTSRVKNLPTH